MTRRIATALALLCCAAPAAAAEDQVQIIHGTPASTATFPHQAAIVVPGGAPALQRQFCGGSVVAPTWVLTAAHCVVDEFTGIQTQNATNTHVILGRDVLSSGAGAELAVKSVIPYSGYLHLLSRNDLALIQLATPTALTPISLVAPGTSNVGETATATGWGDTANGAGTGSDQLLQTTLPVVADGVCTSAYLTYDPDSGLCAGGPRNQPANTDNDTCQGDSGGPLQVPNGTGGWIQIGLTSYGADCGSDVGVYTRLANSTLQNFVVATAGAGTASTPTQNAAPAPTPANTTAPVVSNVFRASAGSKGRTVRVFVAGPGVVAADQASGTTRYVARSSTRAGRQGTVTLRLRIASSGRHKLRRKRGFRVRLRVGFAPTGGVPASRVLRVTVKP